VTNLKFLNNEDYLMSRAEFEAQCEANFEFWETCTDEYEMNLENAWRQYKRGDLD
jgi:hypothetical protein